MLLTFSTTNFIGFGVKGKLIVYVFLDNKRQMTQMFVVLN